MQQFWQECAAEHFKHRRNFKLILRKYGFDVPFPKMFAKFVIETLQNVMILDCANLCLQFLSSKEFENMCFSMNQEMGKKITETIPLRQLAPFQRSDICQVLTNMGRDNFIYVANDVFVKMFVGVAKHYGEEKFLQVLRFTGSLPSRYDDWYGEILNQVAEYLKHVKTRCRLGADICNCYLTNSNLEMNSKDLIPMTSRVSEIDVSSLLFCKKRKNQSC